LESDWSIARRGDVFDNAVAASFIVTLGIELFARGTFTARSHHTPAPNGLAL
jgi:hypothetical protein